MTIENDIKKVIESRLMSIDMELENMTPGAEDFSRAVKDISLLASASAEIQKVSVMAEDNEAKREEQKRMNEKELEIKREQLEIEATRATNDRNFKAQQLKQDIWRLAVDSALQGFAQIGYFGMTRRVMSNEYRISDGSSVLPPNGVQRALDRMQPKKKF